MNKTTSVEEYKLVSSFQSLRKTLLEEKYADRLEKPLAYWALPNDRRLPLAFLGRTLKDLLDTPFEELSSTPGIGQKKISSLMKLFSRAIKDQPPAVPFGINELIEKKPAPDKASRNGFDPSVVSEALWEQWRETVKRHGLGCEKLGRLAPTLQALPTVIWHTPLEAYQDYSLSEIRQLKTHGEKRVRVILNVFYVAHEMLSQLRPQNHLGVRLTPKFVQPLECWINDVLSRPTVPDADEIRQSMLLPLLEQTHTDAGSTIARLAEGRLGINGPAQTVRQQSKRMGVTRARIYQLLEDCNKIMEVRWPEGRLQMRALAEKFQAEPASADSQSLFLAALDLFFPDKNQVREELDEEV